LIKKLEAKHRNLDHLKRQKQPKKVSDLIQGFEAKERRFHSELYKKRNLKKRVQISRPYEPKKKSKQETEIKTKFCQNNP
jgi:hypothetical protein